MTTNMADLWPDSVAGATIGALQSSLDVWNGLPFKVLFVGHALYCTAAGTEFKDRWLLHLLLTFLWGNGGGVITAALIMNPKVATWSFFQSDFITGSWIVCWWLMNWAPGGLPAKLMHIWWIKMLCKSCTMLSRAQLIVARVNLAVHLFPGLHAPALILGTIAGCGGRILADGIMTGWQSMPGLAELTSPGFVSRSAAFAAVSYYTLAYVTQVLPVPAAAGLVVSGLMLHTIASDITGLPLDFTAPVTKLLHTITCVPQPPPQPQPAPVTVVLKQVTPKKQQQAATGSTPAKSPAKSPAKTPAKSPAKQSPAAKQGTPKGAAAVASPLAGGSAGKHRVEVAAAAEDAGAVDVADVVQEFQQQPQQQRAKARRSTAPAVEAAGPGGVTTRRRAAAAAYA